MSGNRARELALTLAMAFGLALHGSAQSSATVQPAEVLSFTIPVTNAPNNRANLTNTRIVLLNAPSWLQLQNTSIIGPVTLPPGLTLHYRLDFVVTQQPPTNGTQNEIVAEVRSDTRDLNADRFVWHFRSSNGFLTSSAEELDGSGNSFGGGLSPDEFAPETSLAFFGPFYEDSSGTVFIATYTSLGLEASDRELSDAETSGVAFSGYQIDAAAATVNELIRFASTVTFTAGAHDIIYGSSDNASNVEPLHHTRLFVDGAAPPRLPALWPAAAIQARGRAAAPIWFLGRTLPTRLVWRGRSSSSAVLVPCSLLATLTS